MLRSNFPKAFDNTDFTPTKRKKSVTPLTLKKQKPKVTKLIQPKAGTKKK